MKPTMETNSPRSTDSDTRSSTWRGPDDDWNVFETFDASISAISLNGSQPRLGHPHHAIQQEPDDSDRQNREKDVRVDQAVVLLPQKSTDARRPVSISLATMTSQAMPRLSRKPVNM